MYYHAKVFTVTLTGKRIKPVTCEKCSTPYFYELSRVVTGQSSAPYGVGKDSAKRRAAKNAEKKLEKRLAKDVELVPCPSCRWVNADLIRTFRNARYRNWSSAAYALIFLAIGIDTIIFFANQDHIPQPPPITSAMWMVLLLALAAITILFIIRRTLRLRINPNHQINGLPAVPAGTPPALLKQGDAYIAVPSEYSNLQTDAAWATYRPGQLVLDPLCCECLDTPTTVFKLPITCEKPLAVPLCQPCLRRIRMRWILRNLAATAIAIPVAFLVSRVIPGTDDVGHDIMWVLGAGLGAFIGLLIVDRLVRPYRVRPVDKSRGIWKISFKNPAYTALLLRRLGEADGLYQPAPATTS